MKSLILLHSDLYHDARVIRQANAASEVGDVTVFCVANQNKRPSALSAAVELICVPYPASRWQTIMKHTCIHREYDFLYQHIAAQAIKCRKIIANDLPTLHSAIQLKKKGICKEVIYDAHEIYTETIKQFFPGKDDMLFIKRIAARLLTMLMVTMGKCYENKAVKHVDRMMTVNNALAQFFKQQYKIPIPSVVRSIPDISEEDSRPINYRKLYNWSIDSIILIYQGAINPGRGLKISIESIKKLPDQYKLVIVGDGPLKKAFEKLINKLNLSHRIKLIGQVPNELLINYTQGANIGLCLIEPINLSKKLSLPNKIFEYIHAGIPILGSDLPEISEVISSFNCGETSPLLVDEIAEVVLKIQQENYTASIKEAKKVLTWDNEKRNLLSILE